MGAFIAVLNRVVYIVCIHLNTPQGGPVTIKINIILQTASSFPASLCQGKYNTERTLFSFQFRGQKIFQLPSKKERKKWPRE